MQSFGKHDGMQYSILNDHWLLFAYQKRWMLQPAMLEDWRMNSVIPSLSNWRGCIDYKDSIFFAKEYSNSSTPQKNERMSLTRDFGLFFLRSLGDVCRLLTLHFFQVPQISPISVPPSVSGEDEHGHADGELQRLIESLTATAEGLVNHLAR